MSFTIPHKCSFINCHRAPVYRLGDGKCSQVADPGVLVCEEHHKIIRSKLVGEELKQALDALHVDQFEVRKLYRSADA